MFGSFFPNNRAVYEIMWKNMVIPDRPQATVSQDAEKCDLPSGKLGRDYRQTHTCNINVLLPTDAQENFFKRNIKIYIKTAPTCFGVITIIKERTI